MNSTTSPLNPVSDVMSLEDRRVMRRAKQVAWGILTTAVVAIGLVTTAAVLHREQRLQTLETLVDVNAATGEQL